MNIVLAHGYLGYGEDDVRDKLAPYFRGVAARLRGLHHDVFAPSVPPTGTIEERSLSLAGQLRTRFPDATTQLHVIAHSMGGLDTRRILVRDVDLRRRIKTLVCIATPHDGSPVARALTATLPGPFSALSVLTPGSLARAARLDRGALQDLAKYRQSLPPDVAGVRYVDIACDGSQSTIGSPLFALVGAIGSLGTLAGFLGFGKKVINDGVVTLDSAQVRKPSSDPIQHELWPVWPTDHCGAIGWPTSWPELDWHSTAPSPSHLQRYEAIIARLCQPLSGH